MYFSVVIAETVIPRINALLVSEREDFVWDEKAKIAMQTVCDGSTSEV
jgi:hypothetical protein